MWCKVNLSVVRVMTGQNTLFCLFYGENSVINTTQYLVCFNHFNPLTTLPYSSPDIHVCYKVRSLLSFISEVVSDYE